MHTIARREPRLHVEDSRSGLARYRLTWGAHDDRTTMAARLPVWVVEIAWLQTPNRHVCGSLSVEVRDSPVYLGPSFCRRFAADQGGGFGIADEAVAALREHHASEAGVELHLSDQLLLPLAVAAGVSEFTVARSTGHLLTNAWTIGRFGLADILIEEGTPHRVRIEPRRFQLP